MGRGLLAPASIASLAWFRVAFGTIMFVEVWRYFVNGRIHDYYVAPSFHFKYYGFSWVEPWPGWGMYLHFGILGAAALGIAFGCFYRVCAAVWFLGFTYVFLLEQACYLNHHYLVCLLSFLMVLVPAHRAFSIDAWRRPAWRRGTVPTWCLWLLRFQMCLVYFMAGVAKITPDWLAGEPMRAWLLRRAHYPVLGPWFTEPWAPYFFSYGGLLFDLLVAPMLCWRRTRWLAFGFAILFNLTNSWLFGIGIFPWMALGATILLFQDRLPQPFPSLWRPAPGLAPGPRAPEAPRVLLVVAGVYVVLQILVPFRHWLYPGDVAWTEEGHRFSWRMLLRSKSGHLSFHVHNPDTGDSWTIFPQNHLTERQYQKCRTRPDMILQAAHYLAADLAAHGVPRAEIRALSSVSLNGRPHAQLIDPEIDLAAEPRHLWTAHWIKPLPSSGGPPPEKARSATDETPSDE